MENRKIKVVNGIAMIYVYKNHDREYQESKPVYLPHKGCWVRQIDFDHYVDANKLVASFREQLNEWELRGIE